MFDLDDALAERFSGIDTMDQQHRGTMLNQNDIVMQLELAEQEYQNNI